MNLVVHAVLVVLCLVLLLVLGQTGLRAVSQLSLSQGTYRRDRPSILVRTGNGLTQEALPLQRTRLGPASSQSCLRGSQNGGSQSCSLKQIDRAQHARWPWTGYILSIFFLNSAFNNKYSDRSHIALI